MAEQEQDLDLELERCGSDKMCIQYTAYRSMYVCCCMLYDVVVVVEFGRYARLDLDFSYHVQCENVLTHSLCIPYLS